MKVKFTKDELYENEGRGKGHTFKQGEIYDLRDDLAQRFIRRGVAEATEPLEGFKPLTRVGGADDAAPADGDASSSGEAKPEDAKAPAQAAPKPAAAGAAVSKPQEADRRARR